MPKSTFTTTPVEIVPVEPRLAAVVRKQVAFADLQRAQMAARAALKEALQAANLEASGPALTVWRMPDAGVMDYAPGVFVPEQMAATGDVTLFTLPQGRAAHLRLSGSYEALPDAWGQLFTACEGQSLAGLNWEVYSAPEGSPTNETDLYALLA